MKHCKGHFYTIFWHIRDKALYALLFLVLMFSAVAVFAAEGHFPAIYKTTARVNARVSPGTQAKVAAVIDAGYFLRVERPAVNGWYAVKYSGQKLYVSEKYLRYAGDVVKEQKKQPAKSKEKSSIVLLSYLKWAVYYIIWFFLFRKIILYLFNAASLLAYKLYWILCIPFYVLNWLQRHLSKPWRIFHKRNSNNDTWNESLRAIYFFLKIPLYILLTPLRFVNAYYYNMLIHCGYEMYNYMLEVLQPSNSKEKGDNFLESAAYAPWRILKYVVWHGTLTFAESAVWTIIDTIVPTLTLFHGTNVDAAMNITCAGRDGYTNYRTGKWNVGSGNFAGNGIYFAPARSTALHYARGALIVCRVSLGNVLDLGLAPRRIYNQCGYANALGATDWGLKNGYVTGEWWRKDTGWWEYCMYDWQNRYNYSWRIRPVYVLNLEDQCVQRVPGGTYHWLFRRLALRDIFASLKDDLGWLFE